MLTEQQLIDSSENEYMNEAQLEFFKDLLESQIAEILANVDSERSKLKEKQHETDELDKALNEEDQRTRMRILDRQTKLLPKLREALKRIDEEEFGYCEVTGEPIGIKRLLARPTATLSIEEKKRQEQKEKNYLGN